MSFNPRCKHYHLENTQLDTYKDSQTQKPLPSHAAQLYSVLWNETREWLIEVCAVSNAAAEAKEQDGFPGWHWQKFQEGDLVLV